jgi:hypothetical protein
MPCAEARTLSVSIDREPSAVVEFVSDPRRLPAWAPGFARSVRRDASGWIVETGDGEIRVEFVPANAFGVVDHRVSGDGLDVLVPMRVVPNADGSEVLFTVVRPAASSDSDFARDIALVAADLQRLKDLLEADAAA